MVNINLIFVVVLNLFYYFYSQKWMKNRRDETLSYKQENTP